MLDTSFLFYDMQIVDAACLLQAVPPTNSPLLFCRVPKISLNRKQNRSGQRALHSFLHGTRRILSLFARALNILPKTVNCVASYVG
jgi:hypothetical protein